MQTEVLQLGLVGKARDELSLPDLALALIDSHVRKLYREGDFRHLARGLIRKRRWQRRHFAIYGLVDDMRTEAGHVGVVHRLSRRETWIELEARVFRLPGGPNHRFVEHRLTSHELLGLIS